jgi:hypothetical protein
MNAKKTLKNQIPQTKSRNNTWLQRQMYELWDNYFADVPRKNLVIIKFGRRSIRQLGSIKWAGKNTRIKSIMRKKDIKELHEISDDKRITVITITRHFKDPTIPEYVVNSTIAHELCHYAHGFSSPEKKRYKYPHHGSIIQKELQKRGLTKLHQQARKWLRQNWAKYLKQNSQ